MSDFKEELLQAQADFSYHPTAYSKSTDEGREAVDTVLQMLSSGDLTNRISIRELHKRVAKRGYVGSLTAFKTMVRKQREQE